MKILVESGIVNARQEGKWTHYSINPDGAAHAVARLAELTKVEGAATHNPACD